MLMLLILVYCGCLNFWLWLWYDDQVGDVLLVVAAGVMLGIYIMCLLCCCGVGVVFPCSVCREIRQRAVFRVCVMLCVYLFVLHA